MNVLNYDREANLDFCEKLFSNPLNSSSIFNILDKLDKEISITAGIIN